MLSIYNGLVCIVHRSRGLSRDGAPAAASEHAACGHCDLTSRKPPCGDFRLWIIVSLTECFNAKNVKTVCLVSLCQLSIRLDQTVAELRKQLTTVVQLSTNSMRLYYIDKCSAFGPEEMKYNNRALHSYSIQDGDEILVVPKTK